MIFTRREANRLRIVALPLVNLFATFAFLLFGGVIIWGLGYEATLHCERAANRCVAKSGFFLLQTDHHEFPLERVVRAKAVYGRRYGQRFLGLREPDGTLSWLPISTESSPLGGEADLADRLDAFLADRAQPTFDARTDFATDDGKVRWIGGLPFVLFGLLVGWTAACLAVIEADLDTRTLRRTRWTVASRDTAEASLADVSAVEIETTGMSRPNRRRSLRRRAVLRMRDGSTVVLSPETTNWHGDADRLVSEVQAIVEGRLS